MKEKRIQDISLEDAYAALMRADWIHEFTRRNLGPVSEWSFSVLNDEKISLAGRFMVSIPQGMYVMVRDEASRRWIALTLPEEYDERT